MAPDRCPLCDSPKHPQTALCLLCDLIRASDGSGNYDACSVGQFRVLSRHWFLKAPPSAWELN